MSKRKGLSLEEKRTRMTEIFYEKRDFFTLKEMEKMAPKMKGITQQTVKEVLQSLVDDRLVQCEKIGTGNYFWAFPSKALTTRTSQIDKMKAEVERLQEQNAKLEASIAEATAGREVTDERAEKLAMLAQLEKEHADHEAELAQFRELDPTLIDIKRKAAEEAKTAANRWTDNIFQLQSYCTDKFMLPRDQFNTQFGIPSELDYV